MADDIMIYATGDWHLEIAVEAAVITFQYLEDMGAKVASVKSLVFSTVDFTRAWLRHFIWPVIRALIPVVVHTRGLGGHLNVSNSRVSPTFTDRLAKVTSVVDRIRHLPHEAAVKAHLIRAKVMPMALYGGETAYVAESRMQKLQASIGRAMGSSSPRRSAHLTFAICSYGDDLDPMANLFTN